jgi:hypothetical protein
MTHLQGLTAAVVVTAGLLLGCGADADPPSAADRPPPPLTADELRRLDTAEARLTQRCLRAHGLSLPRDGERAGPATRRLQRVLFGDRPGALSVRLYGDRAAWFRADTVVGNLEPLAQRRALRDPREDALQRARTAVGRRFRAQIDTQRRLARRALERLRCQDL